LEKKKKESRVGFGCGGYNSKVAVAAEISEAFTNLSIVSGAPVHKLQQVHNKLARYMRGQNQSKMEFRVGCGCGVGVTILKWLWWLRYLKCL
jgi:hypothetical protein